MTIILKKTPTAVRGSRSLSQALKIMSLLAGKFGLDAEIPQKDAAAFLQENKALFTRHASGWAVFAWYLKSFVAEGYVEVLGGEMDKRLKSRKEIEQRIDTLEKSISTMLGHDDESESMEAMVIALRWAIGAPTEEIRGAKGNIWK